MRAASQMEPMRWSRWAGPLGLVVVTILLALLQSQHTALIPPFENDFGVFAARAANWDAILTVDGFYPLGYPLLLWLGSRFSDDPFVAARWIAGISGLALLAIAYGTARLWLTPKCAWLAAALVGINPYYWQWATLVSTDLPWAVMQALSLWLILLALKGKRWSWLMAAGATLGAAYLLRATALVMLPILWLYLLAWRPLDGGWRGNLLAALAFTLCFAVLAAPQLALNWQATGKPFFNLQAKNVWFGIYGQGDWAANWTDVPSDIGLWQVFAMGPWRFVRHWLIEYGRWWGYGALMALGIQRLALQALPTWLQLLSTGSIGALALGAALFAAGKRHVLALGREWWFVALYVAGYGASIALVFVQPRFYLALLPLLGAGLVYMLGQLATRIQWAWLTLAIIALLNSALGMRQILWRMQPPVAEIADQLARAGATAQTVIVSSATWPYTYHTDYRIEPLPQIQNLASLEANLRQREAAFVLFEQTYGARYWPTLATLASGEDYPPFLTPIWQNAHPPTTLYAVRLGANP